MIQNLHGLCWCMLHSVYFVKLASVCEPCVMGAVFLWTDSYLKNVGGAWISVYLIPIISDVGFRHLDSLDVDGFEKILTK